MFGSGISSSINILIRADARQATRTFGTVGRLWRGMTQASSRLRGGLMGLSTLLATTGAGFVSIGLGIRSSLRSMYAYSDQAGRLRSIIHSSGENIASYPGLMASADAASRRWGFGMSEAAEAMGTIVETGTSAADSMRVMADAAEFARVSETDLGDSAQFLVDAHNQFNVPIDRLRELAATINVGSRITATSVEQMRQSFRYAAVEASQMGYSAAETTAALGALASVGLKGMTAGTRLRQTLVKLSGPTKAAIDMSVRFGLSADRLTGIMHDENGQLRPMVEGFERWRAILAELNPQQRVLLSAQVVGTRALAGALTFGSAESETFQRTLAHLSDTSRILSEHTRGAEARMQGFAAQANLAKRAGEELGITFAEILLGSEGEMEFGRTLTDFATAVRLSDETARNTEASRAAWAALSPEMQQRGVEWRETFIGLAELLRTVVQYGLAVTRWIAQNPKLATSLFGVYLVVSMLAPMVTALASAFSGFGAVLGGGGTAAAVAGEGAAVAPAAAVATTGLSALTVAIGATAAAAAAADGTWRWGGRVMSSLFGMSDEYAQVHESAVAATEAVSASWFRYIPVLGGVYDGIMDINSAYDQMIAAEKTVERQQLTTALRETSPNARLGREIAAGTSRGMSTADSEQRASARMMDERMMSVAAMLRHEESWWGDITGNEAYGDVDPTEALGQFHTLLREQGIRSESLIDELTQQYGRAVTALGTEGLRAESDRLNRAGVRMSDLFGGFQRGLDYSGTGFNRGQRDDPNGFRVPSTPRPVLRDSSGVYSGYLPEHLISQAARDAISAAHASRAGETAAPPIDNRVTLDANIQIPVVIDGREVARVADRYRISSDGRSGDVEPGRRAANAAGR